MTHILEYGDSPDTNAFNALTSGGLITDGTPVASYGRYSQLTIVRMDSQSLTRTDRFYVVVDQHNRRIGRSFQYLRNARKEAARLARRPEYA